MPLDRIGTILFAICALGVAGCGGSSTPAGPSPTATPTRAPSHPTMTPAPPTATPTVAATAAAGTFLTYPLPGNGTGGMTVGSDANLWMTIDPDIVARATTAGVVTAFSLDGGAGGNLEPDGITNGADGTLWLALRGANAIANVDTTGRVLATFPLGNTSGPDRIALGHDANLYFTEGNDASVTGRITPTGTYLDLTLYPNLATDVVAASNGTLWYATGNGVVAFSPNGTFVAYPDPQNVPIEEVCAAPDGSIWATSATPTAPGLYHVSLTGTYASFAVPQASVGTVVGVACGKQHVYAVATYGGGTPGVPQKLFLEYDYAGTLVLAAFDTAAHGGPAAPARLVEGPDGNLWSVSTGVLEKWAIR